MSKTVFRNAEFEIVPIKSKNPLYQFALKLKGKTVAKGRHVSGLYEFMDCNLPAKSYLNFDAALLPRPIHYYAYVKEKNCLGMHYMACIFLDGKSGKFEFSFKAGEKHYANMLINPTQVLLAFSKLVKAAGYDTTGDIEFNDAYPWATITASFPQKGNVYLFYKKHLDVFESLMAQAADEVKKKILAR